MNRTIAVVLFATATWITGPKATAQAKELKVDVPFHFTVNNISLPAGHYTFGFDPMLPNTLIIVDQAKNVRARAFILRGSIGEGREARLIFHRYGGENFLSEVGFNSAADGVFLPVTRLEKQARVNRNEELASIAGR